MELVPPPPGSINLIVACDENRGIGLNGRLPWRIKEDWQWYMGHTLGGCLVIGRVSYCAMLKGGHVNDQRRFHVISRDATLAGPSTQVFADTTSAVDAARATGLPIWICGGTRIYEQTLPIADRLYLTEIHTTAEADAWMPDWSPWFGTSIYHCESSDAKFRYTFEVMGRRHEETGNRH